MEVAFVGGEVLTRQGVTVVTETPFMPSQAPPPIAGWERMGEKEGQEGEGVRWGSPDDCGRREANNLTPPLSLFLANLQVGCQLKQPLASVTIAL